jgi:hypothetical protein
MSYRVRLSERDFQRQVLALARLCGWDHYHTHDSRRSREGFPDLVLWHPIRGVIFAELKTETGRVRPEQEQVLVGLRAAGARAYLWRPSDWPMIEETLIGRRSA